MHDDEVSQSLLAIVHEHRALRGWGEPNRTRKRRKFQRMCRAVQAAQLDQARQYYGIPTKDPESH